MISFSTDASLDTPKEKQGKLARKFRDLRVLRDRKRESLAEMSGVPEPSIKRFELTGEISLRSLLRLAHALGALDQFDSVFDPPVATSLVEIEQREKRTAGTPRKRGRR